MRAAASRAPDDALEVFSPATAAWFRESFAQPTPAQAGAWQAIADGQDTLVVAPTGSGKTLAAFLTAIDALAFPREPATMARPTGTSVLYISPLKALGMDVERNLTSPLAGTTRAAAPLGLTHRDVTVGVRTGDTPASERRRLVSHPPDVLITTDRKSTRLNSSHVAISYAVFCLKKKKDHSEGSD